VLSHKKEPKYHQHILPSNVKHHPDFHDDHAEALHKEHKEHDEEYEPLRIPPNWDLARDHAKSR
jgi:hypothetical protein